MIFQAFESEVPPLKVRYLPMPWRVKSSERVHQTQKSFSTLKALSPIERFTSMNALKRLSS